jgi:hypothetical protein
MSQPRIDKDVPIPARYPFADMQVGDSFAVPTHIKRSAINVAAMRYGRQHGMKFTVRLTPERSLRCWRVA